MTLEGTQALNALNKSQKQRLHQKYFDELKSLNRTAVWAKKEFNIKKLTRHHLSAFFHTNGWNVHPPNGRSVMPFNRDDYYDGDGKLAVLMIESAYDDIIGYQNGQTRFIDFISACWFFTGDIYQNCLDILDRNNYSSFTPNQNMEIVGNSEMGTLPIDQSVIVKGASIYEEILTYWLRK